jgi:hypothetical protein
MLFRKPLSESTGSERLLALFPNAKVDGSPALVSESGGAVQVSISVKGHDEKDNN